MVLGYAVYRQVPGHRWYLGKNTDKNRYEWISEWIVTKPMNDLFPFVYKTKEAAERVSRYFAGSAVLELKGNLNN